MSFESEALRRLTVFCLIRRDEGESTLGRIFKVSAGDSPRCEERRGLRPRGSQQDEESQSPNKRPSDFCLRLFERQLTG